MKPADDVDGESKEENFDEDAYLSGKVPVLRESVDKELPPRSSVDDGRPPRPGQPLSIEGWGFWLLAVLMQGAWEKSTNRSHSSVAIQSIYL